MGIGSMTAPEASACFCVGPQPGETLCPCAKRQQYGRYHYTPNHGGGWTCPKCGSIYGPTHPECYRCNPPAVIGAAVGVDVREAT